MPPRSVARVVLAIVLLSATSLACSPGPDAGQLASLLASSGPGSSGTPAPSASGPSASVGTGPSNSPASTAPTPTPGPSFTVYVVARGDSLTSIARNYQTTPRSIAYWNRDTYPTLDPDSPNYAPNKIEIGWKLRLLPGVTNEDPSPLPSRRATPIPIASGSRAPAPTLPPDGSALLVANGSRDVNAVALTFNLGGEIDPTLDVITWLADNDVRATFVINGAATGTDAGKRALQLIGAHPDLFGVANGSFDGTALTDLTDPQIQDSLRQTDDAVTAALGRSTKPLFRPPLGAQDAHVRAAASAAGWPYMVMWDVDTQDAKPSSEGGPTADDIVAKVLSRAQKGSIVLLHVGGERTAEALPGIVGGLRARGLEPVTLAELLNL